MDVLNIHERSLSVAPREAGALLDSLASRDDALWPKSAWPPMRLDGPLGVGTRGGHGPVRYTVETYEAARLVVFRFTAPRGFDGTHCFEVVPASAGGCVLRHTIAMKARGPALVTWPLVFRPLHDALLEDCLSLAQVRLRETPVATPWSPWTRLLRWMLAGGRNRRRAQQDPSRGS
jgi:hypothetical protein